MKNGLPRIKHLAGFTVSIYAFFSSFWILCSDRLLALLTNDLTLLTQLQTFKGWAFILFTSGLLYALVRWGLRSLQASYSFLQAVTQGTTDAIFVKNLEGRYLMINPAGAQILGSSMEEVIGKDDTELLAPEIASQLREKDRKVILSGETQVYEVVLPVGNTKRTYLSTTDVYRNPQGEVVGLIGIAQDMTEHKQLLEELKREKEDLAALSTVTANSLSTLNLEELLDVMLQRIVKVMQADAAVILLKKDNHLCVRASIGIDEAVPSANTVPIGQGFAGTIGATMQPLYVEDAQQDSSVFSFYIKPRGIRTMLGVPLARNGNLLGVLHVNWLNIYPVSDRELHLLKIAAERCCSSLLNAQLYEQTKQLQERLQLQMDHMPIGCILNDRQLRVRDWNSAAENIFGFTKEEVLGTDACELIMPPAVRPQVKDIFQKLVAGETTVQSLNENLTKDGRTIICEWHNTPIKDADGTVVGMLSMAQDITKRKQIEEQLRRYAFYEPLTGLPNRTLFLERLEKRIEQAKLGEGGLFAVLLLELERFEIVKYSLGHPAADQLMIVTARRLEAYLQPTDTVAQLRSDEFAILLADIQDRDEAIAIANRIQQQLMLPFDLNGREVFSPINIGIALGGRCQELDSHPSLDTSKEILNSSVAGNALTRSPLTYSDRPENFLRAADTARHHAKRQEPVRHAVFNPAMHEQAVTRFQLETDLRRAVERQQFQVHYQPIVSLETGKITGFEALVRWTHPTRGLVSPNEFIPLAEETGLITTIDWWVVREACIQLGIWQQAFAGETPLTMSVNLSGLQLAQLGLLERLDQILRETGIDGRYLKLEITESGLLRNTTSGIGMLEHLKALGIQLSIDDFGTGYSSLARLHQLPIDTLKIDRSFVNWIGIEGDSLEIVRTIITLAHSLQMDVIAEGIETPQQLAQLRSLRCEYGQGYFFSRPVDSHKTEELLTAQLQW